MTMVASGRSVLLLAALLCAGAAVASSWRWEDREWKCEQRCKDRPGQERARCLQECRMEDALGRSRRDDDRSSEDEGSSSGDEHEHRQEHDEHEHEKGGKPYVFARRSFRRIIQSEQGDVRVLRSFAEASSLLRGVRKYRLLVLEAKPRSFVVPSHTDSHRIGYVVKGEGVVTTIQNGERRAYTIKKGHVFVAPAGAITYLANTDGRKKLVIVQVLHTISVPGKFQYFFGPGGRNPESFLSSFSDSILKAAYKTSSERLERLFRKQGQDKGVIVRMSEEQTRELQRGASEGGHGPHWPLPPLPFGESHGPYSLLDQRPSIGNQKHGQLYEADPHSFRDLGDRDHSLRLNFANITAGSMSAPLYNTRSFAIAYVAKGEGYVEIVCPHQHQQSSQSGESEQERERGKGRRREGGGGSKEGKGKGRRSEDEEGSDDEEEKGYHTRYQTIRARLTPGTVFVVPVGHPFVVVASRHSNSNLQIVGFENNADKNEKVFLAGANNALSKLDRVAKAVAFAAMPEEVDEVLGARSEKGFLPGPEEDKEEEEHHGGRHDEVAETFLRMMAARM